MRLLLITDTQDNIPSAGVCRLEQWEGLANETNQHHQRYCFFVGF